MIRKTVTVAATAFSLMAAPALAQDAPAEPKSKAAPQTIC